MAAFFDVEWGKIILMMVGTLLVTGIIVGGLGWFALKGLASYLNNRRDTWEATAAELGLTIDRTSHAIVKPLTGLYNGSQVKITSFGVPRGKSSDNYMSCEAFYSNPIKFPFSIKNRDRILQEIASVFTGYDLQIGLASFDNAFQVESEAPDDLRKLLTHETRGGLDPSVLTDFVLLLNRGCLVEASDLSVKVAVRAEPDQIDLIRSVINDAIPLANRMELAYEATREPTNG